MLLAVLLAIPGLILLAGCHPVAANLGNLLVLLSAFFWAWHVILINYYTKLYDTLSVAFHQFSFCAVASLAADLGFSVLTKPHYLSPLFWHKSLLPSLMVLLYSGIFSVGIAFTLQVHAQKKVPPVPAAVILCLEGVFALFGGWLLLKEKLTLMMLGGALLLCLAMFIAAYSSHKVPA